VSETKSGGDNRMTEESVLKEISDFCLKAGRFESARENLGMEASSIPGLFGDYFASLGELDRKRTAACLVEVCLGKQEGLSGRAAPLVLYLSIAGFKKYFLPYKHVLEEEYSEPSNMRAWVASPDIPLPTNMQEYRKHWSYALLLHRTLRQLGSSVFFAVSEELLRTAVSEAFKKNLVL